MSFSLDSKEVEVPCPACAKKIKKPLRFFKAGKISCPYCKTPIDTKQFARSIKDAEKQISDLARKFGGK
jgi:uncharacterized Zn finger protein (UPF0148 family)